MKPKPDNAPRDKLLGYKGRPARSTGAVDARFAELADRCVKEAGSVMLARIKSHPAYLEILSMGDDVVPLILAKLSQGEYDGWLPALRRITGVNPVQSSCDDAVQVEAWLDWARGRGIAWSEKVNPPNTSREKVASGSYELGVVSGSVTLQATGEGGQGSGRIAMTPEEAERAAAKLVDAARLARQP